LGTVLGKVGVTSIGFPSNRPEQSTPMKINFSVSLSRQPHVAHHHYDPEVTNVEEFQWN